VAERIATDVINDPQGKSRATVQEVLSLLEICGAKLSGDIAIRDLARIEAELESVWKQKRDGFFTGIGMRLARTRR
jgi:hypothetical protein